MPEAKSAKRALKPKQELFCQYYTSYWNATRAARDAGYSEKSAMELGYQLLQLPPVQERIEELSGHALKECGVTRERVLTELARIAFLDLRGAYAPDGSLLAPKDIPEDVIRAVAGIEVDEIWEGYGENRQQTGVTKKLKLNDKVRALDSLAKHLGLAPDRVEHSGPGGKPIETRALTDEQLDARIAEKLEKQRGK